MSFNNLFSTIRRSFIKSPFFVFKQCCLCKTPLMKPLPSLRYLIMGWAYYKEDAVNINISNIFDIFFKNLRQ